MTKPSSNELLKIIKTALKNGDFDWTDQRGLIIYTPLHEDIKYIIVGIKETLK